MKISTKGRYALRMMLDLAEHQGDGYVALKDIAQRQGISKKYLEQIVPMLGRADVLRTTRGYQGGYRLARAPQEYTVGEILCLTEGGLAPVACLDQHPNPCPRCGACATLPMWEGLERVIRNYLDGITLQDLLEQQTARARTTTSSENSTLHKNLRQFKLPEVFRSGDPGHCCCGSL